VSRGAAGWRFVMIGCLVLWAVEAWYVFVRETPAVSIEGQNRRVVDEFGRGEPVLQSLNARNGLTAFEIRVSAAAPTTLFVACELLDVHQGAPGDPPTQFGDETRIINRAAWMVTLGRVSGIEWRRIAIPKFDEPADAAYVIRLRLIDAIPAADTAPRPHAAGLFPDGFPGVALIASKDNVLGGGAMWIAERRQIGSVSLHVFTDQQTAYARFRAQIAPKLPRPLGHPVVVAAIVALYQGALATVAYGLLASRTPAPGIEEPS